MQWRTSGAVAFLAASLTVACGQLPSLQSTSDASNDLSSAQLTPVLETSCQFRGPNPPLTEARREAQRFSDAFPQDWGPPDFKIDNIFDYYYSQLIPGAIEWLVIKGCTDGERSVSENPDSVAAENERVVADQNLAVGRAAALAVTGCMNTDTDAGNYHEPDSSAADEMIMHLCPQLLK